MIPILWIFNVKMEIPKFPLPLQTCSQQSPGTDTLTCIYLTE